MILSPEGSLTTKQLTWIGFPLGGGAFGGKYSTASGYIFFVCFIFLLVVRGSENSDISGLNAKLISFFNIQILKHMQFLHKVTVMRLY